MIRRVLSRALPVALLPGIARRSLAPLSLFAALAAVLLPFASCAAKRSAAGEAQDSRVTIGFSLDSLIVERWIRDRDIFVSTASALDADVIVQNAANDEQQQVAQIRYLIDKGVDVLVIIPQNADILGDIVDKAHSKGIKVISYDRLIRNSGVDLYLSVNSTAVGRIMAEAIVKEAPSGNYVFINGPKSDNNVALVLEGARSVFVKYPGIFHVLDYHADNWSYDLAFEQVSALLEKGTRIDAVVCGNDGLAGGVIRALSEYRLAGKVPVVGQDADIAACQYVVEGSQLITVYKPITELARVAANAAVLFARGERVETSGTINDGSSEVPVVWLEPLEVNRSNIDEVVIGSGFHSGEEIYRNVPIENRPAAWR